MRRNDEAAAATKFALSLAPFHDPVGALVSTLVGASFAVLACWPELEARRRLSRFVKRLAMVAAAALLIAPAIAVARVENKGAAAAGPGGEAPLYAIPAKWRLAADASCPPALAEAANWSCNADEFYAFSRRPSPGGEGEEEAVAGDVQPGPLEASLVAGVLREMGAHWTDSRHLLYPGEQHLGEAIPDPRAQQESNPDDTGVSSQEVSLDRK